MGGNRRVEDGTKSDKSRNKVLNEKSLFQRKGGTIKVCSDFVPYFVPSVKVLLTRGYVAFWNKEQRNAYKRLY